MKNSHQPNKKGETPESIKAFEEYVALGSKRSLSQVAKKLGLPQGTLERWSKRHHWHDRITAMTERSAKLAHDVIEEEFFKSVENLHKFKYTIMSELKARVDRKEKMTVSELVRIWEVVKTELGEPTTILKGEVKENRGNPFAGVFDSFFKNDAKHAAS